jgi:phage shock protein A
MRFLPLAALLIATPALAQQAATSPTPYEQAIWEQVAAEHVQLLQANANNKALSAKVGDMQKQLDAANQHATQLQAELDKAKAAPMPKTPEPAKAAEAPK